MKTKIFLLLPIIIIVIGCNIKKGCEGFIYDNNFELYCKDTLKLNDTIWFYFSYPAVLINNDGCSVTLNQKINTCDFGWLIISDLSENETKSIHGLYHITEFSLYFKIGDCYDKSRDLLHSVYNPEKNIYEIYFGYVVNKTGDFLIRTNLGTIDTSYFSKYLYIDIIDDSVYSNNSNVYGSYYKNIGKSTFKYTVVDK